MSSVELKQRLIKKARKVSFYRHLGVRCVYEYRLSTTQIHFCQKSECNSDEFILITLRYWSSFDYESESEFQEDLNVCKFLEKRPQEAESYYEKIISSLYSFDELLQKPPAFSELGKIKRLVLICDKWNYQSVFLETDNVYIGCHWDTAE